MAPVVGSRATAETGEETPVCGMLFSAVAMAACSLGRMVRVTLSVTVELVSRSRSVFGVRLWASRYWLYEASTPNLP